MGLQVQSFSAKRTNFMVLIAMSLLSTIIAVLLYTQAPAQIPLWYSLAIAESHLVTREFIFALPAFMFVTTLLHSALLSQEKIYESELIRILSKFTYIPLLLFLIALLRVGLVIL